MIQDEEEISPEDDPVLDRLVRERKIPERQLRLTWARVLAIRDILVKELKVDPATFQDLERAHVHRLEQAIRNTIIQELREEEE